MHQKNNSVDLY